MPEFRLAPYRLNQPILPGWFTGAQFGLFNINLGQSAAPEVESAVLDEVGTYGRQLGRIGEALREFVGRAQRRSAGLH